MKSEQPALGPFTIKQVAEALTLTVPQINQWIARGYLKPTGEEGRGRRARQWLFEDCARVRICHEIVGSKIPSEQYAEAVEAACQAPEDYILIIVGPGETETTPTVGGWQVESYNLRRGSASWRVIPANEAADLILSKPAKVRQITLIDIASFITETRDALEFYVRSGGR